MLNSLKTATLMAVLFSTVGCSSIHGVPVDTPLAPTPFSAEKSMAMNLASQTDMPYEYEITGRTFKSPLRDFTQEEIDADYKAITKGQSLSAVGVIYGIGVLRIMGGDLGGAFDLATAGIAQISEPVDRHSARTSRWIVGVPFGDYKSEYDARVAIKDNIIKAMLAEVESYGVTISVEEGVGAYKRPMKSYFAVTKSDERVRLYFYGYDDITNTGTESAIHQKVNFGDGEFDAYALGLRGLISTDKLITGMGHELFNHKEIVGEDNFVNYMKRVSARLPDNYMFYQVSYPKLYIDNKTYTYFDTPVPSIYKGGEKYDFIKK